MKFFVFCVLSYIFPIYANVDVKKCIDPQFKHKFYATSDGILSGKSVMVMDFIVKCQNGIRDLNFFALVDGEIKPIAKSLDGSRYEVSWQMDHKNIKKGNHAVKVYYEEDYSKIKSNILDKTSFQNIKPIYSLDYKHRGVYYGPFVKPQILLIISSVIVWYFAYSTKAKIMN